MRMQKRESGVKHEEGEIIEKVKRETREINERKS